MTIRLENLNSESFVYMGSGLGQHLHSLMSIAFFLSFLFSSFFVFI